MDSFSQNLSDTGQPFLVTLNPTNPPHNAILKWVTSHPIPSPAAAVASRHFNSIQGKRGIWFCGAYQGYGFHEDGFKVRNFLRHFKILQGSSQQGIQKLVKAFFKIADML